MFRFVSLLVLFVSGYLGWHFSTSTPPAEVAEGNSLPSRRSLQRAAWNSDTWLVAYYSEEEETAAAFAEILGPLEEMQSRGIKIKVQALQDIADTALQQHPIILVGTDFPEIVLNNINSLPAISLDHQALDLGHLHLDQHADFAQLTYLPSPWAKQLPMYLIWGQESTTLLQQLEKRMAAGLRSFLWSSWGYEVIRNDKTHCLGYFNDSTWLMDKKVHFEFSPEPVMLQEHAAASYWAFDGAQPTRFNWQDKLTANWQDITAFLGVDSLAQLQLYFYPSVERKALSTGDMEQVHIDQKKKQVHLVSNDYFRGEEWGDHYRLWLQSVLGEGPTTTIEQGLAMQWADEIRGRRWQDWVYQLALADALPPLSMLYDEEQLKTQAPVIGQFAAAAWVDYCLKTIGKDRFLVDYRKDKTSLSIGPSATKAWNNWILNNYATTAPSAKSLPEQRLNGFTLAHEGYRIYNGYGSAKARQSLEAMAAIGVDATAIVPYSYMNNPRKATPIPVVRQAGTENDQAVLFSHFSAQALGQYTLLKPQIWIGRGSWPGDIAFDTAAEWDDFFVYYKRWIMHFALLAEMYGLDAFCIGTEMRYTTLQQPDAWRALIADIRNVYSGTLTYAANWGEECEQITFWQELDFIGVNSYYPLHKNESATDEELLAGAQRVVAKIEQIHRANQRPVWLTEVGYRSAEHPWLSPHAEAGSREIDHAAQARCYEALFTATQEAKWLKGFFWWKWPSDLDHNESDGRGYMPLGKPAEEVLRKYYLGIAQKTN